MIIRQTFSTHFKTLLIAMWTTLLFYFVWWAFGFDKEFFYIVLIFYGFTVLPSFFLHASYYIRNRGMLAEILPDRILIQKDGEERMIESSEIREIVVYKSASMDTGGVPISPMEAYFFVRIYCRNGEKFELTCLMDTKIDKTVKILKGVKIFREKGFFNMV